MALKCLPLLLVICIIHHANGEGCPFADNYKHVKEAVVDQYKEALKLKEDPDPETTTPNGCTCGSICGATLDEGYEYDWCTTLDECGEYSLVYGYWDKCLYLDSAKPDYLSMTWEEKQDQLWKDITADQENADYPSGTEVLTESVQTTFADEWDVMPTGRVKALHSVGGVCQFVINIADSPYTGLLKTGQVHGIIRMGSANDFTDFITPGLTPGAGVKFLRTGQTSANFVALNQLAAMDTSSYNFFKLPLTNNLPDDVPLPLIPVAMKFCQADSCPLKVGISDLTKYDQDGIEVAEPIFPFRVTLEPTGAINFREEYSEIADFVAQFKDIPEGTNIYTLKAHVGPDDTEGSLVLGDMTTYGPCVTSQFGDTKLFFQHQSIWEDKALAPAEWADGYDAECGTLC